MGIEESCLLYLDFNSSLEYQYFFSGLDPPLVNSSHPQDQLATEGEAVALKCVMEASNP